MGTAKFRHYVEKNHRSGNRESIFKGLVPIPVGRVVFFLIYNPQVFVNCHKTRHCVVTRMFLFLKLIRMIFTFR